eukprot:11410855-Alexandrium_andersonii.AAC.1
MARWPGVMSARASRARAAMQTNRGTQATNACAHVCACIARAGVLASAASAAKKDHISDKQSTRKH